MTSSATPASHPAVVLFDLDGVLASRDTFATFVLRRFRRRPLKMLLALPVLPLLVATRRRPRLHGAINRHLVRVALLGDEVQEVRAEAAELGGEFARTATWILRPGVEQALNHLSRGDRVVVVTATERGLARSLLDGIGLTEVELVASELAQGRSGPRLQPHNYAGEKRRRLLAAGIAEPWEIVYSDSLSDEPLLIAARRRVLVNPSRTLLTRAQRRMSSVETATWR